MLPYRILFTALICAIITMQPRALRASHISGGAFTYTYKADTNINGSSFRKYEVTLYLYQDCATGVPDAIQQDNPAFFTVHRNDGILFRVDTNIYYDGTPGKDGAIEVPLELETACGSVYADLNKCLLRKKFTKIYYLPVDGQGYTVVYQRCCRPSTIENLQAPSEKGITFFCEIPASVINTSAVFSNHPPQVICLMNTTTSDQHATDADGDSLTYALEGLYEGASGPDIKPRVASAPPYPTVAYAAGYSQSEPLGTKGIVSIDEKTGLLSVTSTSTGTFQVGIVCKEWRGGQLINTVRREITWSAVNCGAAAIYKPYAGGNRTVLKGDTVHFHAKGAARYNWQPATFLNDATIANPIGTFTTVGEYTYEVYGETDNGCSGKDEIKVSVVEHTQYTAPNAFTPNGDGYNDRLYPLPVGAVQFISMRIFNRWGNELFISNNPAQGWDGTYGNKQQDMGVYVWVIEYTDSFGEPRIAKGSTVLLR